MFGERLREQRKKAGLTMKDFGKKFNLAESTISGYENGIRKPDMELVEKFADFFEVSVDYLIGRTAKPNMIAEGSFFYFDKEGLTEEETELLEQSYKMMRERARKRAEEKKNKYNK